MLRRVLRFDSLFVGQLPFNATKEQVAKLFPFEVKEVTLPSSKAVSGENKGFAFIKFKDDADVNKAILMHNSKEKFVLGNRVLNLDVEHSNKREQTGLNNRLHSGTVREDSGEPNPILFVGNLASNTTEQQLSDLFKDAKSTKIVKDYQSGTCMGYGFVTFDSTDMATKVMEENKNLAIESRPVLLGFAKSTNKRTRPLQMNPCSSLFVGNLPTNASYTDLEPYFPNAIGFRVMIGKQDQCLGFGFVDFKTVEEATATLENTSELLIKGQSAYLSYATKPSNIKSEPEEAN